MYEELSDEDERKLGRLLARGHQTGEGCLLWPGACSAGGYGVVWDEGRAKRVHRVIAVLHLGLDESSGLCVLHTCDVRACFNPAHLWLGTQAENVADAVRKGRIRRKLSEADVVEIRRLAHEGQTYKSIADRFGVTPENIGQIVRRQTWRHVPDPAPSQGLEALDDLDSLASAA